jgi:hypothetical protein
MEDIQEQMIVVTTEHQVRSKGMLLQGKRHLTGLMQVTQPGRVRVMLTDRILRMKEKELQRLKTTVETETEILI